MNIDREKLESMIIDYIDGKLNTIDRQSVERQLMQNADAYRVYEQLKEVIGLMDRSEQLIPSSNLGKNFQKALAEEAKPKKVVLMHTAWYRAAAAVALLIVGGGIGYFISTQMTREKEMLALKKEMEITRQLVLSQLSDDQSASMRLTGVKAAYESVAGNKPDDAIVDALIVTMNGDDNSNVRLAAIEALSHFVHEPKVKSALIGSLTSQTDPIVQITLIQLMVQLKELEAIKSLQQIIDREESLPAVKDEAHAGIFKLS